MCELQKKRKKNSIRFAWCVHHSYMYICIQAYIDVHIVQYRCSEKWSKKKFYSLCVSFYLTFVFHFIPSFDWWYTEWNRHTHCRIFCSPNVRPSVYVCINDSKCPYKYKYKPNRTVKRIASYIGHLIWVFSLSQMIGDEPELKLK